MVKGLMVDMVGSSCGVVRMAPQLLARRHLDAFHQNAPLALLNKSDKRSGPLSARAKD